MQPPDGNQNNKTVTLSEPQRLAEAIRDACIQAALTGYNDASMSGLCHEGAWECAVDAMRSLNLDPIVEQHKACLP